MDNNYFDFLGQNSVAGNENANANSNNDKGKVNLTVRVDADCQVVCDGDFLFLANANQIVKDKAPMGQHLMNFTSLDYPEATIEKIVDFPDEGNNYLIVVNELKEKVEKLQKDKEAEKQAKQQAEERNSELEKAMNLYKNGEFSEAKSLFEKNKECLNNEQQLIYDDCVAKAFDEYARKQDIAAAMCRYKEGKYREAKKYFDYQKKSLNSEQMVIYNDCVAKIEEEEAAEKNKKRDYEKTHDVEFSINGASFQMIYVKGGTYNFQRTYVATLGKTGEKKLWYRSTERKVTVQDFHIGKFVVTQRLWKAIMGSESTYKGGWELETGRNDNYPAYRVTWYDCQDFINKINELTGRKFRLPTEAEWEFAARGGNRSDDYIFSGGNDWDKVAWVEYNSDKKIHKVGMLAANELGIYDMSGNVSEWCSDWYSKLDYLLNIEEAATAAAVDNPKGPNSGSARIIRGGAYFNEVSECSVASRDKYDPNRAHRGIGFRLVLDV